MFVNGSKKWLLIGGGLIMVIMVLLVLVGASRVYLSTRAFPLPDLTESIIGGRLKGARITEGTHQLEFRAKTNDGKTVSDRVTFKTGSAGSGAVTVSGPKSITVDYAKSLVQMIAAGNYFWVNNQVTAANFPVTGSGIVTSGVVLLHFNPGVTTDNVLQELNSRGLRPVTLPELLAYAAQYPDADLNVTIVALGSPGTQFEGKVGHPVIDDAFDHAQNKRLWKLNIFYTGAGVWGDSELNKYLFAAVPISSPSPSPVAVSCGNRVANESLENPAINNPSTNNLWQVFASIPGWTTSYVELQAEGLFGKAQSGRQYAEIDSEGSVNLNQTIATSPGDQYRLRFFYALRPNAGQQQMGVYWNGSLIGTVGGTPTASSIVWQEKVFTVSAQAATSTFGFGSIRGNGAGNFIDNVSLKLISSACPS